MDHQLAYACVTPEQDRNNIERWENLGRPGGVGGQKGLNFGRDSDPQGNRTFGRWHNLGGRLTEVPALGGGLAGDPAVRKEFLADDGAGLISCVVLRKNGELWLRELQLTKEEYSGWRA
jgi:hypothetical protein